jgi:hypothetical protein
MGTTEIIITNVLATGSRFAVLADDMTQSAFIPSKITATRPVRPGERVQAVLVPNVAHGDKTPWMAVSLDGGMDLTAPPSELERLILADLDEGRATALEIADSIDRPEEAVRNALTDMISRGKIIAYQVFDLPEGE